LIFDVVSFNERGMGPTDGTESRREHAIAFLESALLPGATLSMNKIARNVALPVITQEVDGRYSPNARRDQILRDTVQLVWDQHDLKPTRTSGANESGCSIVEEVLPKFLGWLRKYPDELLSRFPDQPKYRELRRWADTKLRKLPEKLFPDGPLSEKSIANIWEARPRS